MFTPIEKERMELAKLTTKLTNCLGTIYFIKGFSNKDRYLGIGEKRWHSGLFDEFLESMVKIEHPCEGAVFIIRGNYVEHAGIITHENPVLVYHRPGISEKIEEGIPLETLNGLWGNNTYKIDSIEECMANKTLEFYIGSEYK
jgi:hypothetical protein